MLSQEGPLLPENVNEYTPANEVAKAICENPNQWPMEAITKSIETIVTGVKNQAIVPLERAASEIKSLRTRNNEMYGRLNMFDTVVALVNTHNRRGGDCCVDGNDVVYNIENVLNRFKNLPNYSGPETLGKKAI